MDPLHAGVARFLRAQRISRAEPILVACSAGGDSVALLQVLAALGQRVGACHVHHGIRGAEADCDLECARAHAARLGVAWWCARVEAGRRDGDSPEARARRLRYAALERARAAGRYTWVATAHTLDDQAETVLLRATRGSDLGGLAGVAAADRERRLLRPLLAARRDALRRYLRARGIPWREDATNADLRAPRNRLRAQVLPALEASQPGAIAHLGELAEAAADTEAWLRSAAAPLLEGVRAGEGGLWLDGPSLLAAPSPLRRRALVELLARIGLRERITRRHLVRIEGFLARGASGRRLSLPRASVLAREGSDVWLGPEPGPRPLEPFRAELRPPEPLERPERGVRLRWQRSPGPAPVRNGVWLPRPLPGPLVARSPRAGDRIHTGRGSRPRALRALFADARWGGWARSRAVVVELDGEVLWVVGLAHSTRAPSGGTDGWQLLGAPFGGPRQLLESDGMSRS